MSKVINPQQAAQKYQSAMSSSATRQNYIDGINSVTTSPMAQAAQADQLFLQRVTESVNSGRRAAALNAVPLQTYKDNAIKKGADRLASGAAAAVSKVQAHFQKWGPIYQQVSDAVAQMPKGSRADSAARANKAMNMLMDAAGRT